VTIDCGFCAGGVALSAKLWVRQNGFKAANVIFIQKCQNFIELDNCFVCGIWTIWFGLLEVM
jgi:hypothetical protein